MNLLVVTARRRAIDLYPLAMTDGALAAYKFDEASGSLVNGVTPGTYDFSDVSPAMTRQTTGVSGPDRLAITGSGAAGAAPHYGHAEANTPNLSGCTTFTMEIVVRVSLAGGYVFNIDKSGTETAGFGVSGSFLNSGISVAGFPFNSLAVSNTCDTQFEHIVTTWDGQTHRTYKDGALVTSAAIGPGGTGLFAAGGNKMGLTGAVAFAGGNTTAEVDFLAIYNTVVLSAPQVAAHFAASGC